VVDYEDFEGLQVRKYTDKRELERAIAGGAARFTDLVRDRKPTEWVVENLIPKGACLLMAGDPKLAMKSYLSMQLSLCIARGEPFLGLRTVGPATSIYCNLEDGRSRTANRAFRFGVREDSTRERKSWAITDPEQLPLLVEMVRHARPTVVFIDPLINLALLHGKDDENNSVQVTKVIRAYQALAQQTGTAIIIVHHYNKSGDIRGSSALRASCDGWLEIDPCKDDRRLLSATLRDGEEGFFQIGIEIGRDGLGNLEFQALEPQDVEVVAASELRRKSKSGKAKSKGNADGPSDSPNDVRNRISALLLSKEGEVLSVREIRENVSGRASTISKLLADLESEGLVERGPGRKGWTWVPVVRNTDPDPDLAA
jgi:DNA-binding transcriptional ArsR family regulator